MNDRMKKLMAALPEDVDAVLITGGINRFYYTGLRSSAGTLVLSRTKAIFVIDFRYIEVARATVQGAEVVLQKELGPQLTELLAEMGAKRVGVESNYTTVAEFLALRDMLPEAELVFDNRVGDLTMAQRRVKTPEELQCLQRAQDIADKSFGELLGFIRAGVSEKDIHYKLEALMRSNGSEATSFATITVAGPNSSRPHGVPSDYVLREGDFLTMDFGAMVGGYGSDMTRTVAIGQVSDEMKKVYHTVLQAQEAALAAIRSGVPCNEIDKVARDIISEAGYGDSFGHGLGHSIGLEIHENPRFNPTCTELTQPGIVMSVEPGIYLDGRFGVRIEDMVVVTEDGCINMTHSPKELIVL